nr:kinase/pyrophosphorylase [Bacilli bacterium]
MSQVPIIYIISDSLGETAEFVARAAAIQFSKHPCTIHHISHVRSLTTLEEAVRKAKQEEAIIAFTIVQPELRDYVKKKAIEFDVQTVDVLSPMLEALETAIGAKPDYKVGLLHQLDDDYFRRVSAIEFAVKNDDGRNASASLAQADIILIGVSRTSKTPLSMYLAHKRLKVMNIPLVPEIAPIDELFQLPYRKKIIGLTISSEQLNRIRQERLKSMGLFVEANYANQERILEEILYADSIMRRLGCPVINVSDKAVEETAAWILDYIAKGDILREQMGSSFS